MLHRVIIFLLASAVAGAAGDHFQASIWRPQIEVPGGQQPLQDGGSECDTASAGDYVCGKNCTVVLICVGDGSGDLQPIEVERCEEGVTSCSAKEGTCVNGTSTCDLANNTIMCHGIGMFPDPYSCTVFHICTEVGKQSTRKECDEGWAYDPLTTECSKSPTDSICTQLPIECKRSGETGVMPGNPSIYYLCVVNGNGELYPDLYRCLHGEIYNPSIYSCVESTS